MKRAKVVGGWKFENNEATHRESKGVVTGVMVTGGELLVYHDYITKDRVVEGIYNIVVPLNVIRRLLETSEES